mmetsp:Transcript_119792/g.339065  ORF Transcript_119792/g.339065 Transcript_119792/m.339065 type:complete len:248 (+) Transcript_119792:58-801(+)
MGGVAAKDGCSSHQAVTLRGFSCGDLSLSRTCHADCGAGAVNCDEDLVAVHFVDCFDRIDDLILSTFEPILSDYQKSDHSIPSWDDGGFPLTPPEARKLAPSVPWVTVQPPSPEGTPLAEMQAQASAPELSGTDHVTGHLVVPGALQHEAPTTPMRSGERSPYLGGERSPYRGGVLCLFTPSPPASPCSRDVGCEGGVACAQPGDIPQSLEGLDDEGLLKVAIQRSLVDGGRGFQRRAGSPAEGLRR